MSEQDKTSLVRRLDSSLLSVSTAGGNQERPTTFTFGSQQTTTTHTHRNHDNTHIGKIGSSIQQHKPNITTNSKESLTLPPHSAIRKLSPKGICSWNGCNHTLLEADYCREPNCTNPVHHVCQGTWECAPGGTELGPGVLRCPPHHQFFSALEKLNKPIMSLTSALNKTPRSSDSTWTPAPTVQEKLSFSSNTSFATEHTHSRTTSATPSSKTSSLTMSAASTLTSRRNKKGTLCSQIPVRRYSLPPRSGMLAFRNKMSQPPCLWPPKASKYRPKCCFS